jgi:hypothetical protein
MIVRISLVLRTKLKPACGSTVEVVVTSRVESCERMRGSIKQ